MTAILVVLSGSAAPSPGDRYGTPLGISLLEARVADVEKRMGEALPRAGDACVGMPGRRVVAFDMRELHGFAAAGCGVFDERRAAALDLVVGGLAFVGNRPLTDRPHFGLDVVLAARFTGRRLTELDVSSAARPLSTGHSALNRSVSLKAGGAGGPAGRRTSYFRPMQFA